MKWKIIMGMAIFFLAIQCAQYKEVAQSSQDRIRQVRPGDISSYHDAIKIEVAWMPYQEHKLVKTKKGDWKVVRDDDTDTKSAMPVMLLSYPGARDSLWLDMNMDNEMFGRLLKHTLMTQVPISRPFTEYIEVAKCAQCHPKHIEIDF